MKFSKEEIELCRKIADRVRFEKYVKEGDWVRNEYGNSSTDLVDSKYIRDVLRFTDVKHWFPLWILSDCLEWLYQREIPLEFKPRYDPWAIKRGWRWHLWWGEPKDDIKPWGGAINAMTPLEACLKAVLAVLEAK